MGIEIKSTITITERGCEMPRKHSSNPHTHKYKSSAYSHENRLFHKVSRELAHGVSQNVDVAVNLHDESPDCITSCFKGLAGMFKK